MTTSSNGAEPSMVSGESMVSNEEEADVGVTTEPEDDTAGVESSEDEAAAPAHQTSRWRRLASKRAAVYIALPAVAMLLAAASGYLKWQDASYRDSETAGGAALQAAMDSTVAMLSYRPDSVAQDLGAASDRLTGPFKDSYTSLTHDVVIPGSQQKQISAVAKVVAAAPVSETPNRAVALVFVNQTITEGNGTPTDTASSVRVSLEREDGRWLVSGFDPV